MKKNLFLLDHPILQDKLAVLRNKTTSSVVFRRTLSEISRLVAYEATRDLALSPVELETPMAQTTAYMVSEQPIIVSILRAGNGMMDALQTMLPFASGGHIGIYRDKFIRNTVEYYFRLPKESAGKRILLADPVLATGDTAIASIDRLKEYRVGPIRMLCVLVSGEGVDKVHHFHPDVEIYAVSQEPELNQDGYLIPGIGDAGNRLYQSSRTVAD